MYNGDFEKGMSTTTLRIYLQTNEACNKTQMENNNQEYKPVRIPIAYYPSLKRMVMRKAAEYLIQIRCLHGKSNNGEAIRLNDTMVLSRKQMLESCYKNPENFKLLDKKLRRKKGIENTHNLFKNLRYMTLELMRTIPDVAILLDIEPYDNPKIDRSIILKHMNFTIAKSAYMLLHYIMCNELNKFIFAWRKKSKHNNFQNVYEYMNKICFIDRQQIPADIKRRNRSPEY